MSQNLERVEYYHTKGEYENTLSQLTAVESELTKLNKKLAVIASIKLCQLKDNVWFPQEIIVKVYEVDEKTSNSQLVNTRTITCADDFKVNVELPEDIFLIDFPSGTAVVDSTADTTYRVP